MKKLLFVGIMLFILIACKNENQKNRINIETESTNTIGSIIDSVKYISFEESDNIMFSGRVDKMMGKGDTLFLLDFDITKSLVAYNIEGDLLYKVSQVGKKDSEYIELFGFTIDEQYIYGLDNAKKRIMLFDITDGAYIKSYDIPIHAYDIALLNDGNFLLSYDRKTKDGGVYVFNKESGAVKKIYTIEKENYCVYANMNVFSESDNKITYSRHGSDEIYVFDKDDYLNPEVYFVDFGSLSSANVDKLSIDEFNKSKYITPPVYLYNDYFIGHMNIPHLRGFWKHGAYAYDTVNKIFYNNEDISDILVNDMKIKDELVLTMLGVANDNIYSIINDYGRYIDLVNLGFPKADKHLEKKLENSIPLIVIYNLK